MSKSETPKLYLEVFPVSVISPLTTRPSPAAKPVSPASKTDTQNLTTSHQPQYQQLIPLMFTCHYRLFSRLEN